MKPNATHRSRLGVLLAAVSLAVAGCAVPLTPAARAVRFSDAATTQRCQALGEVTAVDSSLRSRQVAWNGLRNAAAARTATHVVLIPYASQPSGYTIQRARAFRCGG
ncbi:MAG: hypothetical protein JWM10_3784 [Myxococcaceae bacterium]|nr:hypothetical protein [Myxococcaceae bacterium]